MISDRPGPLALALVLAGLAGCGRQQPAGPPKHPVRGTVTYNGRPMSGAVVTLYKTPVGTADPMALYPCGTVGPDGAFAVGTDDPGDGAAAHGYAVTVRWTGESGGPGPDLLGGRFADPNNPVLTFTVTAGDNAVPPIELTGPPVDPAGAGGRLDRGRR